MNCSTSKRSLRRSLSASLIVGICLMAPGMQSGSLGDDARSVQLTGHVPALAGNSELVARVQPQDAIHAAITLPLHNEAALKQLIERLYTPGDPLEGDFLTPEAFASRFAPTEADYKAVIAYATANGLQVEQEHPNRLLLDVVGPASAVEKAFGTRLAVYKTADGRLFRAPQSEPSVPAAIAGRLQGVVGLDTAAVLKPHYKISNNVNGVQVNRVLPHFGTGPNAALAPSDIKKAYNLSSVTQTGAGQTLALFELDGFKASDITAYEKQFGLPIVQPTTILVDSFNGAAGSGADEVTLDIELMMAIAPNAQILVYEGPNSVKGLLDVYSKIASDNRAKSVSTSWGLDEASAGSSMRSSENSIFMQMAAQGQSLYAASGDNGAYDNGRTLSVDDPASQPYATGVGGTTLTNNHTTLAYVSEQTWSGSGGGRSAYWSIPSYQSGVVSSASLGSTSMRNVPDVALNADPNTGYAIYSGGKWITVGGTSCAAPLWAAFTALVNEARGSAGAIGFLNPSIYKLGGYSRYAADMHDIADGSKNLYYPAVVNYDLATGWGSFNGAMLLADLVSGNFGVSNGGSNGGGNGGGSGPTQLLGNPGFENGSIATPWSATAGVIDASTSQPAHAGSWKAWLDGYGAAHTDTLSQTVAIPAKSTSVTLSFWLHIDTRETSRTTANDTLKVQIRNSSGTVLSTLATYSNLDAASGYRQRSFDLSAYKGQTITLYLIGVENGSLTTSFVVDDFSLTAQ